MKSGSKRNIGKYALHRTRTACCLLFLAVRCFSQESNTTPTITSDLSTMPNTTIVYYEIAGSTESEMREQLNLFRPKGHNDTTDYDALTDWSFEWGWPGRGTTDCDLGKSTVTFQISVTLPHWTPPADAPPALRDKWEKYLQALISHEKSHVDNIVAHYSAVVSAIKNADCYTAAKKGEEVLEEIRREEEFYDAITKHGTQRGAVFP